MTRQPPAPSQDDSSAQVSSPGNLAVSTPSSNAVQPSHVGSLTGQDLLRASAYSLPDWLTSFRSLSDSSTPQLAMSSPAPGVYARDFAYPLRTSQGQWQPSPFSPTSDHGEGATGNGPNDPASDYEASLVPSFVLNLFPNHPTAQGADGSARHTWGPQRST
ncbi:hypothetical protein N7461_002054 [Penicillium sp. DV-2018c]|nr:hypothetical protein N7461_002054 [Penicillium sp. DV-2018c]